MSYRQLCRRVFIGAFALLPALGLGGVGGEDLSLAPPPFTHQGKNLIPVDIAYAELAITFDVGSKKAIGKSRIEFYSQSAGYPLLDLVPEAQAVSLNGQPLGAQGFPLASTPDGISKLRYVNKEVKAFSHNLVEIEYALPSEHVTFSSGGVSVGFFMSDVGQDRAFLEQYAPSNLEFDHFQMTVTLKLVGSTATHQLFTNGRVSGPAGDWTIVYPSYFTTSSFYLHLTEKKMAAESTEYKGMAATIPITVYSTSASSTSSGIARTKSLLAELEGTFGPFPHESVTAYLAGSGGMEHCGATMTSLSALGHELTHSWFARGVMPSNGNAGWIDEAIASWRDNGYPTSAAGTSRPPVNLGAFSAYRRVTPSAAYTDGARLMSEFDSMFKSNGGLKTVLKALFSQYQRTSISSPLLQTFLETTTGQDLKTTFNRYVYGKSSWRDRFQTGAPQSLPPMHSHHPRPYTKEELRSFR